MPFLIKLTYKYANAQETADDLGLPVECVYNPTINERLLNELIVEEWYLKDNFRSPIKTKRFWNTYKGIL